MFARLVRPLILFSVLSAMASSALARDIHLADFQFRGGDSTPRLVGAGSIGEVRDLVQALSGLQHLKFLVLSRSGRMPRDQGSALIYSLNLNSLAGRISEKASNQVLPDRVSLVVKAPAQPPVRCPWQVTLDGPDGHSVTVPLRDKQTLFLLPQHRLRFEPARRVPNSAVEFRSQKGGGFQPINGTRFSKGDVRLSVFAQKKGGSDRSTANSPTEVHTAKSLRCMISLR